MAWAVTIGNGLAFASDGTLYLDPGCTPGTGCEDSVYGLATVDPLTGSKV